jgi:hypothetical protein
MKRGQIKARLVEFITQEFFISDKNYHTIFNIKEKGSKSSFFFSNDLSVVPGKVAVPIEEKVFERITIVDKNSHTYEFFVNREDAQFAFPIIDSLVHNATKELELKLHILEDSNNTKQLCINTLKKYLKTPWYIRLFLKLPKLNEDN